MAQKPKMEKHLLSKYWSRFAEKVLRPQGIELGSELDLVARRAFYGGFGSFMAFAADEYTKLPPLEGMAQMGALEVELEEFCQLAEQGLV